MKWGQQSLDNFQADPPSRGIVHQVNLEYLASVARQENGIWLADTLVGTDSHTTMVNGLGVLGWGVGGIEAEAVMLGQPIYMLAPDVVGMRLTGSLKQGVTATDMTLRIVELLRSIALPCQGRWSPVDGASREGQLGRGPRVAHQLGACPLVGCLFTI